MSEELTLRLIEKIQEGIDIEESSRKLLELNYRKVMGFFRRKGFSVEESRDLTQDVFSRVFNAIDTFRRESRAERWFFEIALNIYRNELRRRSSEKRDAIEVPLDVERAIDPRSEDLLLQAIQREQADALRAAFAELPEQMRQCCILRYERGLKYQEIADLMAISIETTKAHLHQARKRLVAKLGDAGNIRNREA